MRCDEKKKHVAVLPYPYTSHPMVMAGQAVRLAAAAPNIHFSFINIPSSNAAIFSSLDLPTNLKVYDIATQPSGLNLYEKIEWYYTTASQSYEAVIAAAEAEMGVPVSCLLIDCFAAFGIEIIAAKMGVRCIAVWVGAPYGLLAHIHTHAIIDHLRLHSQHGLFDLNSEKKNKRKIDFVPGLSMMRVEDLTTAHFEYGTGSTNPIVHVLAEVGSLLPKADAVVLNCFEEETLTESTSVLRSKVKTLLHIGYPVTAQSQRSDSSDKSGCLSWLNNQSPKSVVYVSFGTMSFLSPEEILGIAEALEKMETPYLWSLKDQTHLPAGFVERTISYGKLVEWAPQTLVLSHPSVGAHLMHAGFNSMLESVIAEVPMIFRPIWADNMMNARIAEEVWQIGVGVEGRVITKNGLVKCLEMVLGGGEEEKRMRDKIKVLKEVMVEANTSNGSATKDFNSLVELISS